MWGFFGRFWDMCQDYVEMLLAFVGILFLRLFCGNGFVGIILLPFCVGCVLALAHLLGQGFLDVVPLGLLQNVLSEGVTQGMFWTSPVYDTFWRILNVKGGNEVHCQVWVLELLRPYIKYKTCSSPCASGECSYLQNSYL